MILPINFEATGTELALVLRADDLVKLFGTNGKAININSMLVYPNSFGVAQEILMLADHSGFNPKGASQAFSFAELSELSESQVRGGATDPRIMRVVEPGSKTFFRFTTADIAPQGKSFSLWPIFEYLIIGWSADVDFVIEFDYTILDRGMNNRSQIMELLANKRSTEDPNLTNTQGKRALRRGGLLLEV